MSCGAGVSTTPTVYLSGKVGVVRCFLASPGLEFWARQLKEPGIGLHVTEARDLMCKSAYSKPQATCREALVLIPGLTRGSDISAFTLRVDFFIFWVDFWFVVSTRHCSRVWTLWNWGDQKLIRKAPQDGGPWGHRMWPLAGRFRALVSGTGFSLWGFQPLLLGSSVTPLRTVVETSRPAFHWTSCSVCFPISCCLFWQGYVFLIN